VFDCGSGRVAGVWRIARLDEQKVRLLLCDRSVLDALWDDVKIARRQLYLAVPELDREVPFEDEEEVVRLRMRMPRRIANRPSSL